MWSPCAALELVRGPSRRAGRYRRHVRAPPELDGAVLREDEIVLVGAPELGGRRWPRRDVEKLTWVTREKGSATRAASEAAALQHGLAASRRSLELVSWEWMQLAVAGGAGVRAAISRIAMDAVELKAGTLAILGRALVARVAPDGRRLCARRAVSAARGNAPRAAARDARRLVEVEHRRPEQHQRPAPGRRGRSRRGSSRRPGREAAHEHLPREEEDDDECRDRAERMYPVGPAELDRTAERGATPVRSSTAAGTEQADEGQASGRGRARTQGQERRPAAARASRRRVAIASVRALGLTSPAIAQA